VGKDKSYDRKEGGTTPLYTLSQRLFLEPTRLYKGERASLYSNVGG